jgi:hypothetical protein
MPPVGRRFTVRTVTLVGTASLAVHQLRYMLWYGGGSDRALSAQGHAYLMVVGPLVVAAAVLACAGFLHRLARGARAEAPGVLRLWAVLTVVLAAMFCVQESLEGLLADGHPEGVAAVGGHGGWLAAPLSLAIGLLLALALRAAVRAGELLPRSRALRPRLPARAPLFQIAGSLLARREPLLAAASARAPPAASA